MAKKTVTFFSQSAPDEGGLHMSLCSEQGLIGGIEDVETLLRLLHGVKGGVVAYLDELDIVAPDIVAYMVDERGAVECDGKGMHDKITFVSTDGKTYYKVLESTRTAYAVDDKKGGIKHINKKDVTNHYDRYLDACDSFVCMCSPEKWASLKVLYDNKTIEFRSWRRIVPADDADIMRAAGEGTLCVAVMRLVEQFAALGVDLKKCVTIGQAAIRGLTDSMGGRKAYAANYPEIDKETHDMLSLAYHGGICSMHDTQHVEGVDGYVVDANSLYMAMVRNRPMPYGPVQAVKPELVDAWVAYKCYGIDDGIRATMPTLKPEQYEAWADNFHFIGAFRFEASVRDGREPSLHQPQRGIGKIISRTIGEEELYLCRPDLERVVRDYKTGPIACVWAYTFSCSRPGENACVPYIDYWYGMKAQFAADGNKAGRLLCKLMLNNISGKFAQRKSIIEGHFAGMTDNGPKFDARVKETRASYIPLAIYLTAYARTELLDVVHANWDNVLYMDTDGVHLSAAPHDVDIGDGLGQWKIESRFDTAAYFNKKVYVEAMCGVVTVKMAGANPEVVQALIYGCQSVHDLIVEINHGVTLPGKVIVHHTRGRTWKTYDGAYTIRPVAMTTREYVDYVITESSMQDTAAAVGELSDDDGWTNPFS